MIRLAAVSATVYIIPRNFKLLIIGMQCHNFFEDKSHISDNSSY